jgi:hypothetical protein
MRLIVLNERSKQDDGKLRIETIVTPSDSYFKVTSKFKYIGPIRTRVLLENYKTFSKNPKFRIFF